MSQSQRVLASLASLIVLIPILVVVVVLVLLYCCKRGKCKKSHSKPPLGRGADSVTTDERIVMEAAGSVAEQSSDEADGKVIHYCTLMLIHITHLHVVQVQYTTHLETSHVLL